MPVPTTPLPSVQGFTFTVGSAIAKIDKLLFSPDPDHVDELLTLVLQKGSPCETDHLRCDDQGEFRGYVNTQFQLGGKEDYIKRSDPSKQSTSFTQVNVSVAARRHNLCNQALRDAHDYSYHTGKVVTVDLKAGTATVGVNTRSAKVSTITCTSCKYSKVLPSGATAPSKCPRCKKDTIVTS